MTRWSMRWSMLSFVVLSQSVSCFSPKEEGSPVEENSDAGLTPDAYAAAWGVLDCEEQHVCFDLSQATLEPCEAEALDGGGYLGGLGAAVDAGRMRYDSTAATECLAQLADAGCFATSPACALAAVGAVGIGGSCRFYDCSDGFCQLTAPYDPLSCTGYTCIPYVGQGQVCDSSFYICDPAQPLFCNSGVCQLLSTVDAGTACDELTSVCAAGSACVSGVCVPSAGLENEPCTDDLTACQAGLFCALPAIVPPVFQVTGVCTPMAGLGQTCGQTAALANENFTYISPQCGAVTAACQGQAISIDGGLTPGVCAPVSDVGGPCIPLPAGDEPLPGHPDSGALVSGCKFDLICVDSVCQVPVHTSCVPPGFCTDGFYCDANQTCQPPLPAGAPCSNATSSQCASGFCDAQGQCTTPCSSLL